MNLIDETVDQDGHHKQVYANQTGSQTAGQFLLKKASDGGQRDDSQGTDKSPPKPLAGVLLPEEEGIDTDYNERHSNQCIQGYK